MLRQTLPALFVAAACSSSAPSNPDGGAGADASAMNACPQPTGDPISHHDTVAADETWAGDKIHLVTFGFDVNMGATLTIQPCATVRIQHGYSIVVEGTLTAEGTADKPIAFIPDDDAQPWGDLQVFAPGVIRLAHATVRGGGAEMSNSFAMIEARGDQTLVAQPSLKLDHVRVEGSQSYGISLRGSGGFTADSQAVTVTGSKIAPMRALPRLTTNIPSGDYTGNAEDSIVIITEAYGDVNLEDVVMHDRGVRYRLGQDGFSPQLTVGPNAVRLTIEAGVRIAVWKGGLIVVKDDNVASTGTLVARGTAEKPIVFTSAESSPAAGDWRGIELGRLPSPGEAIEHVEVRYAGGPSFANGFHCQPNPTVPGEYSHNEDAAIAIYHQPAANAVVASAIFDSAGDGIDLAYTGDFVDLKGGNTFMGVARCAVSLPRPTTGSCPDQGCP